MRYRRSIADPEDPASDDSPPEPVILSDLLPNTVEWLWPDRIPLGRLTVLDGDPGLGKSSLLLDLAARLSAGLPMPDGLESPVAPAGVVLLCAEDDLADTVRPRLEAAGADLRRIVAVPYLPVRRGGRLLYLQDDCLLLMELVRQAEARLLVVDPLAAYVPSSVNLASDRVIRLALMPLRLLAERLDLAVVTVRHLTKHDGRNPLYRGAGAVALLGVARAGLFVAPDPDDATGQRRVLATTKSNLGPVAPSLAYRLVPSPDGASVLSWEGPVQYSAAALLDRRAARPERAPGALEEALTVLRTILADGPLRATEVQRQAAQAGVSHATIRRAREALGIRPRKLGNSDLWGPTWLWSLPTPSDLPTAQDTQPATL